MQFDQLRRREFITLLGDAAAAWPIATRGQQATLPTIGFLGESTPPAQRERTAAFVQRLRELGWIEGRTVAIEYRWAEGRTERFAEIAKMTSSELAQKRATRGNMAKAFAVQCANSRESVGHSGLMLPMS